ncbi:MAG: precorrin-6y C5,15-methyltransferase (decarboxylating) subunit CbiE, partial [Actinomycetota bacterium]|nr:precorrin-6y C5,15-methyltransferase (decarboxylating) subunit CbiE [Actinomycetota bacterium]
TTEGPVAVLASGDPGFFGIVRMLGERFGRESLRVLPGRSSAALAFARAGLHWDDAVIVSAHGREPRRAVNVCRAHPKVAVLTSPGFGPAELACDLEGWGRSLFVAEGLGGEEERCFRGDAATVAQMEWRDPNVVITIDEEQARAGKGWISSGAESPGRWALPESEFEHRSGMITKGEIRAAVLARLGPGPGDLVWDVGAGSGSVAIECARFGAAAIAVERDGESCDRSPQKRRPPRRRRPDNRWGGAGGAPGPARARRRVRGRDGGPFRGDRQALRRRHAPGRRPYPDLPRTRRACGGDSGELRPRGGDDAPSGVEGRGRGRPAPPRPRDPRLRGLRAQG